MKTKPTRKAATAKPVAHEGLAMQYGPEWKKSVSKLRKADIVDLLENALRFRTQSLDAIPTNWLDPLLTGPEAALKGTGDWGCPDIERLINGIKARLNNQPVGAAAAPDEARVQKP